MTNNDSDDATAWLVEEWYGEYIREGFGTFPKRIDAIERALRIARGHSCEVGEPVEEGTGVETRFSTGTESEFYVVLCGGRKWRVIPAVSNQITTPDDDDGKVPLPDCDAATAGWPDSEDPPELDEDADPEEWKEPLPDEIDEITEQRGTLSYDEPYPHGMEKGAYGWLVKYHSSPLEYVPIAHVSTRIDAIQVAARIARRRSKLTGYPVEVYNILEEGKNGREYSYLEIVCGNNIDDIEKGQKEWIIVPAPPPESDEGKEP